MAHQIRCNGTAAQTLLPATVTLTNDAKVTLVVADDLKKRSTSFTVKNVHCHFIATLLQLLAVGVHALNSLMAQLLEQFVLLLAVNRQRTRNPWTTQDVRRKNCAKENVAIPRANPCLPIM